MTVRQWDIVTTGVWGQDHPAVVLTPESMRFKEYLNVLACSSKRVGRPPEAHEVVLDEADGLDWPTFCKLAPIYAVRLADVERHRGEVSPERRRQIGEKLIRLFGLLVG